MFSRTIVKSHFCFLKSVSAWFNVSTVRNLANLSKEKCEQSEYNKVGSASEVRQLVHLKGGSYSEEDELHPHSHDGAHGKVILVEYVNRHSLVSYPRLVEIGTETESDRTTISNNFEEHYRLSISFILFFLFYFFYNIIF